MRRGESKTRHDLSTIKRGSTYLKCVRLLQAHNEYQGVSVDPARLSMCLGEAHTTLRQIGCQSAVYRIHDQPSAPQSIAYSVWELASLDGPKVRKTEWLASDSALRLAPMSFDDVTLLYSDHHRRPQWSPASTETPRCRETRPLGRHPKALPAVSHQAAVPRDRYTPRSPGPLARPIF